ncbi:hypothetical protein ACN4EK_29530 [Pantanalinema rosaneae CENA516]|uniref:hypothetical protein n=1 Tax=Pantanalinema rosaneae TaxID=1620701 RepID=UPI003D6DDF80
MFKLHSRCSRSLSLVMPVAALFGMVAVAVGSTSANAYELPPVEAQPIERSTAGVGYSITVYPSYRYPVRYPGRYPVGGSGGYRRSINNAVIINPTIINSQIRNSTLINPTIVAPQRPGVYRAAPYSGSNRAVIRYPTIEVVPSTYPRYRY